MADSKVPEFTEGQTVRIISRGGWVEFDKNICGCMGNSGYVSLQPGVTGVIVRPHCSDYMDAPVFRPHGWPAPDDFHIRGFVLSAETLQPWDGPETPCTYFMFDGHGGRIVLDHWIDDVRDFAQSKH